MNHITSIDDLPDSFFKENLVDDAIAIDTEAMGLNPHRDRLCLVQISVGNGIAYLVQIKNIKADRPNLNNLLKNDLVLKIMHYARFDMMMILKYLDIKMQNVFCTKVASRLIRTFTDKHGLKSLCREILGIEITKHEQSSDWGRGDLTDAQLSYAAQDVLYLHKLRNKLLEMLIRENRLDLAQNAFNFLPTLAHLDLLGYEPDIFHYTSRVV